MERQVGMQTTTKPQANRQQSPAFTRALIGLCIGLVGALIARPETKSMLFGGGGARGGRVRLAVSTSPSPTAINFELMLR